MAFYFLIQSPGGTIFIHIQKVTIACKASPEKDLKAHSSPLEDVQRIMTLLIGEL